MPLKRHLLAAACALALPLAARADTTVTRIKVEDKVALGTFNHHDAATGVSTTIDVIVWTSGTVEGIPPQTFPPEPQFSLFITQVDDAGNLLQAETLGGNLVPVFTMSGKKIAGARATGQVLMGVLSPEFVVDVDLTWTGTGQTKRDVTPVVTRLPNYLEVGRFSGTTRPATANGTVKFSGKTLTVDAGDSARLTTLDSGFVIRERTTP